MNRVQVKVFEFSCAKTSSSQKCNQIFFKKRKQIDQNSFGEFKVGINVKMWM